jgi:hypothetical protein
LSGATGCLNTDKSFLGIVSLQSGGNQGRGQVEWGLVDGLSPFASQIEVS